MNEEQQRTLTELTVILKRVEQDLAKLEGLKEEVRDLPAVEQRLNEVFHSLYIGDGRDNPPTMERISIIEKDLAKVSRGRRMTPKDRFALYTALLAAIVGIIKTYGNVGS